MWTGKKTQLWNAEAAWPQGRAWAGWRRPSLTLIPAAHQKQPGPLTTADRPQSTQSVYTGPACPVVRLHNRAGVAEAGGVISYEGKEDLDPRLHPSRAKAAIAGTCPESTSERRRASLCSLPSYRPPFLQHLPGAGRGKSIHLKGIEPAWVQSSGLLLQQLGIRSHPNRVRRVTGQKGSHTSHQALVLAPPSPVPPSTKVTAASTC